MIMRTAGEPPATIRATIQNTALTPIRAPKDPAIIGMTKVEAFSAVSRIPRAIPCLAGGVTWISMLMIMGWTLPSASPNTIEHANICDGS
ncbi:hypothetical protein PSE10B_46450 [Pseudomonas amygdali pv. eriobotryae]|nr:hypothetical protein PSE10B_46450 [Pseudomonas amygdali pv. eriobotryae]